MSEKETDDVPTRSKGDVGLSVGRAVLSAIPYVGGSLAELLNLAIAPPLEKRRDEWLASLAGSVERLRAKVEAFRVEDLAQNEVFVTSFLRASQAAIRAHQKEKLNALRNAVLNAALPNRPEEDIILMFLGFIDGFTPWHLRLLKFFNDPIGWVSQNNLPYPKERWDSGKYPPQDIIAYVFPELDGKDGFFNQLVNDLSACGFVGDRYGNPDLIGVNPVGGPTSGTLTTEFGKQFLRFISSPLADAE